MSTTTNTNEMTMRKYHEAVLALPNLPANVEAKAKAEIAKLDATNAKRAEKAAEKAKENDPIKTAIYEYLLANGMKVSADIATALSAGKSEEEKITTNKVSSMCSQMVKEGRLTSCDVKVPKKGKVKGYTAVVKSAEVGEDDPIQVTDAELNSMF